LDNESLSSLDATLNEKEAALRLGISVSRVRQLRYSGKPPTPVKVCGLLVRYPFDEVERARRERLAAGGAR
jgi:hypothetical protein